MTAAKKLDPSPLNHQARIVAHLKGVTLFKDIATIDGAIENLASIMQEKKFPAQSDIIREGDDGTEMYILIEGRASVFKAPPDGEEYKVAIFDGDKNVAFGESGLIEADRRSATIRSDTPCVVLSLDRAAFEQFSIAHPDWALPIYRRISQAVMFRLKKTNNDMLLLYNALVGEIRGR
jgi:CRP-like cAMP-binding protein